MESIKPNDALIDEISEITDTVGFFVLSTDTINPKSTLHTRVFLPHEDAATGEVDPDPQRLAIRQV